MSILQLLRVAPVTALLLLGASPPPAAATATFQVVVEGATARNVSPDGSTVVGRVSAPPSAGLGSAYRWKAGVVSTVPSSVIPGGGGLAASYDGSIFVGHTDREAFRWENGQTTPLGTLPMPYPNPTSGAADVSWDGATIVGNTDSTGFIHQNGVMSPIGFGDVYAVSGDGRVVVGQRSGPTLGVVEAFRWQNGVMTGLGDLEEGPFLSGARDVSYDGSVIVGFGSTTTYYTEAFRWQDGVMTGLGLLPGTSSTAANAVSADGSTIVGEARIVYPNGYEDIAVIWDAAGAHVLEDLLSQSYGLDLSSYDLVRSLGISADGRTIVGEGIQYLPDQTSQGIAWMVVIPEPATAPLVSLGVLALVALRRRR